MSLKCGCQQMTQSTTVTTKTDVNTKGGIEAKTAGPKSEEGFRNSNKNFAGRCESDCSKRPFRETSNLPRPVNPPACCCSFPKSEPCPRRSPTRDSLCKCVRDPVKEWELERERRQKMEMEVDHLKLQIADMLQSKCMALNMTKQLKQRYEKMKVSNQDVNTKMATLQRENEFLSRSLEKERLGIRETKEAKEKRVESGAQVDKDTDKRATKRLKEQFAKIKSLNDSVNSLSKTVEDKDFEKKRLEHEKDKIHEKLKKNKDMTKRLSETNAKLAKSVRQKHDSFMAIRSKAGKYQKELSEYKDEVRRSQMELEKLKYEMEKQKSKGDAMMAAAPPSRGKDTDGLEDKLKKTKDRERRASETVQLLSLRIRQLEAKDPKGMEKELQRVAKGSKIMQIKYDDTLNKLKQMEEADRKKTEIINNEMKTFTEEMAKREIAFTEEKEKMKALVDELQSIIDEQKKRLAELEQLRDQQDIVIKTQNDQLESKEEQIKLREREIDLVKEQCLDLDKQVDNLRTSVDQFESVGAKAAQVEMRERVKELSDEVDGLKAVVTDEKEKANMKDKVIEDQYNTIQQLKAQLSQKDEDLVNLSRESRQLAQTSGEKVQRMSRQLVQEQQITKTTVSNLKTMEKKKKKLEEDVENLEEAYEELSAVSVSEKINEEQKKWEEERKKLIEERDRAIGAAKLATKTLMETMDDFQGQIKSQQRLQKIVTDIISSKSEHNLPPCMRRKEQERIRQLQVAIPCKPAQPCCNLRNRFPQSEEDGFYTASSGKYQSDSEDSAEAPPATGGLYNFLNIPQYSNYLASVPQHSMSMAGQNTCMVPTAAARPMTGQNTCMVPTSAARPSSSARPATATSVLRCRCANSQNYQCQCSHNRTSNPSLLLDQSRQSIQNNYCKTPQQQQQQQKR